MKEARAAATTERERVQREVDEQLEKWKQDSVPVHQCDRNDPSVDNPGVCATCDEYKAKQEEGVPR